MLTRMSKEGRTDKLEELPRVSIQIKENSKDGESYP